MVPVLQSGAMTLTRRTLWFAVYATAIAVGSVTLLRALLQVSRSNEAASHVVLVPVISIALIYHSRRAIFSRVAFGWLGGTLVILAGLALMVGGTNGWTGGPDTSFRLMVAGFVGMWIGGFLLFYGREAFRTAVFPLFFLLFTIPIPATVLDGATEFLKVGSTETTAALFRITGTTFHREDFVFFLPKFAIEVADECSGIRSSIALMLTALIAGHIFLQSPWKKLLLVVAIVPIAIFKNAVRIVSLSLLASYVNPGFLVGRLHNDGGVVFFLMALAVLLPVLDLLRRSDARQTQRRSSRAASEPADTRI